MARGFLHRFSPASFYGRAVLILIIPIIVIQIVVSVVFIQRHYERATAQMTTNVLRDLTFLTQRLENAADPQSVLADLADLTQILQISVQVFPDGTPPPPAQPISRLDLAGREIVRVLSTNLAGFRAADLRSQSGEVRLWLDSRHGVIELGVPRGLVTTSNQHQLLVIVFLASVLMTLIAFQFLRLQIRPIRRLGAAAEAYGRGERVALRPSGAREIRAAAHAFMDMRNRIERARVQQRVMLSGVSHDMRTPLTRMRLILSMMADDEDRAALETEITDLEKRLEGFLDYTRGQMAEDRAPTDPRALVGDLVDRYRMAGHEIGLQIAEQVPPALALNAGTTSRALDNLISNALRHGTRVRVTCEVSRPWLEISVEDNGPGIPEPDRARACEPFARLDEARNSDSGGLGLGLAIAAEAARAHGGALLLEDSALLGGLRAVLQLPLPQSP